MVKNRVRHFMARFMLIYLYIQKKGEFNDKSIHIIEICLM